MGFLNWLTGSSNKAGGPRAQRSIAKHVRRLLNEAAQTADRLRSIGALTNDGSEDAVYGLCMRFTYRAPVQIVDEDEKERVFEALLSLGSRAVPALKRMVHDEATGQRVRDIAGERFTAGLPSIYWPLRALTEIAGEDEALDVLLAELDRTTEGYERDVQQRVELASNLREFRSERAFQKLVELLSDEHEDVLVIAIDGLTAHDRPEVADHLVQLLLRPDQSLRVRTMVIEFLFERQLPVKSWKKELSALMPPAFWVDDTGVIRRR